MRDDNWAADAAGGPGQEVTLDLLLRVVADVGIVGLPNAGKSSLLAALTRCALLPGAPPHRRCCLSVSGCVGFFKVSRVSRWTCCCAWSPTWASSPCPTRASPRCWPRSPGMRTLGALPSTFTKGFSGFFRVFNNCQCKRVGYLCLLMDLVRV